MQVAVATNPTHYGNPSTGCESDEVAVRVSGLSGDFCSPKCDSQGTCPSDVPKGDTATPECALRTSTGDKYCGLICQADSDCGAIPALALPAVMTQVAVRVSGLSGDFCSPKCDSQGTCPSDVPKGDTANPECALRTTTGDKYCGLICHADSDCGAIPALALPAVMTQAIQKEEVFVQGCFGTWIGLDWLGMARLQVVVATNPTHYGNPSTGCESDEVAVRGDTANPECALRTTTGDKYCGLICQADSDCGTGSCQKMMGIGLCTYASSIVKALPAVMTQVAVATNPTHYGNPSTGCESDELWDLPQGHAQGLWNWILPDQPGGRPLHLRRRGCSAPAATSSCRGGTDHRLSMLEASFRGCPAPTCEAVFRLTPEW
eukprot:s640_g7.t1